MRRLNFLILSKSKDSQWMAAVNYTGQDVRGEGSSSSCVKISWLNWMYVRHQEKKKRNKNKTVENEINIMFGAF